MCLFKFGSTRGKPSVAHRDDRHASVACNTYCIYICMYVGTWTRAAHQLSAPDSVYRQCIQFVLANEEEMGFVKFA